MEKTISISSYEVLKLSGHVVPRDKNGNIITSFKVGGKYTVVSTENNEPITVKCTQDCPHHLVVFKEKTKECSDVLQLMDRDYTYSNALDFVLKNNPNLSKIELETELNNYI